MDWFQILVIILSIFLAIFLILGIVLLVLIIKLTKQIKSVTDNAKSAIGRFVSTASTVSKATSPDYIGRFVSKFFTKLKD